MKEGWQVREGFPEEAELRLNTKGRAFVRIQRKGGTFQIPASGKKHRAWGIPCVRSQQAGQRGCQGALCWLTHSGTGDGCGVEKVQ